MHGDERSAMARAEAVDGVRDEFFAGAAFARDEDGGPRWRDLFDRVEHMRHGR